MLSRCKIAYTNNSKHLNKDIAKFAVRGLKSRLVAQGKCTAMKYFLHRFATMIPKSLVRRTMLP